MSDIQREQRKRKREILIIIAAISLLGILTLVEVRIFKVVPPEEANLVVYGLLHLNAILLLLVAYLVIRNVLKLFFDRQKGRLAEKLRTRIAVAFLFLSLVPTIFLFLISFKFIDTSLEYWFSSNLDRKLQEALFEAQNFYQEKEQELTNKGQIFIKNYLSKTKYLNKYNIYQWRKRLGLDSLEIFNTSGKLLIASYKGKENWPNHINSSTINYIIKAKEPLARSIRLRDKVLLRVFLITPYKEKQLIVATGLFLDPGLEKLLRDVGKGVETYRQLKFFKEPLKISLILILLLVTLLTLFVAIWFGMRFSKRLTEPVQALAEATEQIATGNFNVDLPPESPDEVGRLVRSFKNMTKELREYRDKVEQTTSALNQAYQELRKRTFYLETVLANITAGVVALDDHWRITLINRIAAKLFGAPQHRLLGRHMKKVLPPKYHHQAEELLKRVKQHPHRIVQHIVTVPIKGEPKTLSITVTLLEPDQGKPLGYLCLFEDITEKEKIQRLAAWREVARRIAHEVKNPLTPIQLSAQRLRRRFIDKLNAEERAILERCTTTIENQVEELKHLVNEFSNFARLPVLNLQINNIEEVIREVVNLYREGHPEVKFSIYTSGSVMCRFDREQMKRVFLNLFDNAIRVMQGKGEIIINCYNVNQHLRIEVSDTGPGIPGEIRNRLFEPYFSREGGSGLGLAIVHSIIREHKGKIYVGEASQGAKFVIELSQEP